MFNTVLNGKNGTPKAFADIAALATQQRADEWVQRLSSLAKGKCYSIGKNLSPDGRRLVNRALKIA